MESNLPKGRFVRALRQNGKTARRSALRTSASVGLGRCGLQLKGKPNCLGKLRNILNRMFYREVSLTLIFFTVNVPVPFFCHFQNVSGYLSYFIFLSNHSLSFLFLSNHSYA